MHDHINIYIGYEDKQKPHALWGQKCLGNNIISITYNDNDKFYYLGSIYEALGRDIMNRNINKIDKHLAIKYLQGAFMYYKCCSGDYAELAIDHLKNYITNRL